MVENVLDVNAAIEILGMEKVIIDSVSCMVFRQSANGLDTMVRYSEKTLRECAAENREEGGLADWRMVYIHPLSLRQQLEVIGTNHVNRSHFHDGEWWLLPKHDWWAMSHPEAGYYLVDVVPRYDDTPWDVQSMAISEHVGCERADERVYSQVLIAFRSAHNELLNPGTYHWGRVSITSREGPGMRVFVGFSDYGSLHVSADGESRCADFKAVCLSRKFDF